MAILMKNDRWVALLNLPGQIATFNAGIPDGNTANAYFNYLFLTEEKGLRFDLVVLVTQVNDWSWRVRTQILRWNRVCGWLSRLFERLVSRPAQYGLGRYPETAGAARRSSGARCSSDTCMTRFITRRMAADRWRNPPLPSSAAY